MAIRMAIWLYGYMAIWVYGYMGIWVYGYMAIWLYGSMGIWVYGYMGIPAILTLKHLCELWDMCVMKIGVSAEIN